MTQPQITVGLVVLDTADVDRESRFWADLLGGTIAAQDDDWHTVTAPDGTKIGLQLAPDHVRPQWPDGQPQQIHLDLDVTDIAAAHEHALSVGATVLSPSEGPDRAREHGFVVYADPAGHPFCLCW